ncbi:MAG: uncharacterized membrane-anchored protein YhcB (DUF1043 family) [Glaciecola sp.]|jgi:uncharacterized membrane-anchored protein YhcB (DUF1043 family)
MEIGTLVIGIIIGLIIGGLIGFISVKSMQSKTAKKATHTEEELKALLAIQASQHLNVSRQALTDIQNKTAELAGQLNNYEDSLRKANSSADETKDTFFGEHASVFLRNNFKTSKNDLALAQPDTQPRDFANSGSGVFVGLSSEPVEVNKSREE